MQYSEVIVQPPELVEGDASAPTRSADGERRERLHSEWQNYLWSKNGGAILHRHFYIDICHQKADIKFSGGVR